MITIKDYKNPYGLWRVTTEGDCEGRSTKNLGIYQGYIDDIAFALADKCSYVLRFEKICTDIPKPTKAIPKVAISLDIKSGIWDLNSEERVNFFRNMLQGRNIRVFDSNFATSITLENANIEQTKREIALAKLTSEEKSLLGLSI